MQVTAEGRISRHQATRLALAFQLHLQEESVGGFFVEPYARQNSGSAGELRSGPSLEFIFGPALRILHPSSAVFCACEEFGQVL